LNFEKNISTGSKNKCGYSCNKNYYR